MSQDDLNFIVANLNYPPLMFANGKAFLSLLAAVAIEGVLYFLVQQHIGAPKTIRLLASGTLLVAVFYSSGLLAKSYDWQSCHMLMMTHPERYSGMSGMRWILPFFKLLSGIGVGVYLWTGAIWGLILGIVGTLIYTAARDKAIAGKFPSIPSVLYIGAVGLEIAVFRVFAAVIKLH